MNSNRSEVVLLGDYDYDYPRETNIREGLKEHDVEVLDCQFSEEQRFIGVTKVLLMPLFYLRVVFRMETLLRDHDPDAIFVTKFNPLVLPLAWLYSRRIRVPLVYDLFVSLHRTAEMRDIHPVLVRMIFVIELVTLRLPDYHTVGTNQFIELYSDMYSIPQHQFIRLPPGADQEWYHPIDVPYRDEFTALYWGNFLPHHGVETIINAAEVLQKRGISDVSIVFVGKGPRKGAIETEAQKRDLENVQFEGFVEMEVLQNWIATSHVGLGVFSSDKRAMASITNKVSEGVAMAKAMITERSPAIEEWFEDGKDIYLVPPDDGDELADAIIDCKENPDLVSRLEKNAYDVFESEFSQQIIGKILKEELDL